MTQREKYLDYSGHMEPVRDCRGWPSSSCRLRCCGRACRPHHRCSTMQLCMALERSTTAR